MYYALIIVILIQQLSLICCQVHFPDIPCPDIFKYIYNGTRWTAEITLPTPDVNEVVLITNFTVPKNNLYDTGILYLNNKNFSDDISNNKPFIYTYLFAETEYIPKLIGITYNGNTLCIGPETSDSPYMKYSLSHKVNLPNFDKIVPQRPTNWPKSTQQPLISGYENDQNCGLIRNKRQLNNYDTDDVVHFIYNGTAVARNNHPWLVAIYDTDKGPFTFFCSGNLISAKHVLSAAHCTLRKKNIKVKVGAHNTNDFFESGAILRDVAKTINHQEFRSGSGNADISILVLSKSVGFTEFVKPICLWDKQNDINEIIGERGRIMGWGLTEKGDTSSVPLQTDVGIVSQQQCQSVEILKGVVSDTTICAGTKGAGPCIGDSGGGLLLKRQGKWYIRGIISISIGNRRTNTCDVNTYAVYADTAKYMNWIIRNME